MQENKITKPRQKHMNILINDHACTVLFDGNLEAFINKKTKTIDNAKYLVFKDILGHQHHMRRSAILDYEIFD